MGCDNYYVRIIMESWDTSWGDMERVDQFRTHRLTICLLTENMRHYSHILFRHRTNICYHK